MAITTTTPKPMYLDLITSTLTLGSTGEQVKALQEYLRGMEGAGSLIKVDGFFGPGTEAAVKRYQKDNELVIDGKWGPKSLARAKDTGGSERMTGVPGSAAARDKEFYMNIQRELNEKFGAGLVVDGIWGPKSRVAKEKALAGEVTRIDSQTKQTETGTEYNQQEWDEALKKNLADISPSYAETQKMATADLASSVAQKQDDYNEYLRTQGLDFQRQKTELDQSAADRGVLFSGGRVQKESQLQSGFEDAQGYRQRTLERGIGSLSRGFEEKFGTAATQGLSSYYQPGRNTYNPNVATGGVGRTGGLSSAYQTVGGIVGSQPNLMLAAGKVAASEALRARKSKGLLGSYNF